MIEFVNPYTRSLLKQLHDRRLARFVFAWDRLEELIIRIYKAGAATEEDESDFQKTLRWLSGHYPSWQPALSRYWPQLRAGGELLDNDPFETLLSIQKGAEVAGNWRAMQILPAAREALNQFLLDRIGR